MPRAAQAALEEQVRTEAAEGELRLTDEQQAEYYRIQEEAGSRTAKLRADHAALQAAQARPRMLTHCQKRSYVCMMPHDARARVNGLGKEAKNISFYKLSQGR